jgi:hypothetical protein
MFSGFAFTFALAMGSNQGQYKRGSVPSNPLTNCLIGNTYSRVFDGQSFGDEFWDYADRRRFSTWWRIESPLRLSARCKLCETDNSQPKLEGVSFKLR